MEEIIRLIPKKSTVEDVTDGQCNDYFLEQFLSQYKEFHLVNYNEELMAILDKLFVYIKSHKHSLVSTYSQFLGGLIQNTQDKRLIQKCSLWIFDTLSKADATNNSDVLNLLQKIIIDVKGDNSCPKNIDIFFKRDSIILRQIDVQNRKWDEKEYQVLNFFNTIFSVLQKQNCLIEPKDRHELKLVVLKTLSKLPINNLDKMYINKVVKVCLRLLRLTIDVSNLKNSEELGLLLGIAQAYVFHEIQGFPVTSPKPMITCNLNLPVQIDSNLKKKYFRNHKVKKPSALKKVEQKSVLTSPTPKTVKGTSDSETSDNESRSVGAPLDRKIRLEAAHLLNDIVQCHSREFTGYWLQMVASGSRDNLRTLAKYVVRETAQANRTVALSVLNELLLASKVFLSHANDTERSSYDSVFYLLGLSIKEIHDSVCQLLRKENGILPLIQALKCASALAEATPFSRLKPGLASELAKLCYPLLMNKDNTVKVKAFEFFETLVLSEPVTQEVYNVFAKSSNDSLYVLSDSTYNTASETETEEIVIDDISDNVSQIGLNAIQDNVQEAKIGAIVEICLKTLSKDRTREPVMLRAIMLIRAMAFNAFSLVYPHLEYTAECLIEPMKNHEEDTSRITLQAIRALEVMAQRLKDDEYSDKALVFWKTVFPDVISLTGHKGASNLREAACDCLANIDNSVLMQQMNFDVNSKLKKYWIATIVSALSECVSDDESSVRAAALRAFGILVTLPALEEDTGFLWDVHRCACQGFGDENLGVRIKAAWAVANLSETLIKRKHKMKLNPEIKGCEDGANDSEDNLDEPEPIDFISILEKPYTLSVSGARDKDKVRCNAVRAIGNIIYLYQNIHSERDDSESKIVQDSMKNVFEPPKSEQIKNIKKKCKKAGKKNFEVSVKETAEKDNLAESNENVFTLQNSTAGLSALINCLRNTNDMKVKWNACRALGIIISGTPDATLTSSWRDIVFNVVTDQMCRCPNFKVRTNAAWVITVCKSFGEEIKMIWKRIMEAFENSKTLSSINEYQHYEALVEQLCLAFCHIAVYTDFKWFDSLSIEIENHFDNVSPIIKRFQEKVLPEKAGELIEAKTRFSLFSKKEMSPNEKQFVKQIVKLFENDDRLKDVLSM
ncbi:HEAT repeat-containing protein 6-like [Copidosoma floridanum]|uniref:HEAT repeat-containing protein 6-like n=1 Tax=Copidosoma floridanum TaxID=29053 RepID=UPI0006C995AA|nr:HEAT repeat-containing protein 6-like [Copidosoma floridanum]